MRILSLDIGRRRTGVAFADDAINVPMALNTLHHRSVEQLVEQVGELIHEKSIDELLIGLPLLLSGIEGEQVEFVRSCADQLERFGLPIAFLDERYTTVKGGELDGDAVAACDLLTTYLAQRQHS